MKVELTAIKAAQNNFWVQQLVQKLQNVELQTKLPGFNKLKLAGATQAMRFAVNTCWQDEGEISVDVELRAEGIHPDDFGERSIVAFISEQILQMECDWERGNWPTWHIPALISV